ncbi:MAG: hypothetical protein WAM97_03510, partial [Acidimicrobiales bacterium]
RQLSGRGRGNWPPTPSPVHYVSSAQGSADSDSYSLIGILGIGELGMPGSVRRPAFFRMRPSRSGIDD